MNHEKRNRGKRKHVAWMMRTEDGILQLGSFFKAGMMGERGQIFIYLCSLMGFKRFINRDGIDFSGAQNMQAVQEWDLIKNLNGVLEFQTRYAKFQSAASITLYFPNNIGGDTSKIHYIGFKGEAIQVNALPMIKFYGFMLLFRLSIGTINDTFLIDKSWLRLKF